MNVKKHNPGEINESPIPLRVLDKIKKAGLTICSYYENIQAEIRPKQSIRTFPYYCLSHLIDGDGFYLDGDTEELTKLNPGDLIMVVTGKKHQYGGMKKNYTEDSICFSGYIADAFHSAGIIENRILRVGNERILLPIINKLRDISLPAQFEANIMLQQMLIDLHRESNITSAESIPGKKLKLLLREMHRHPEKWWTVNEMADYCYISENYLRELFRAHTGIAPKEYIDRHKLNQAMELLRTRSLKIAEIAYRLGYKDQYHFSRRFTQLQGMPPTHYRKAYSHFN